MSADPIGEAVRAGALAALRTRISALGEKVRLARMSAEKDGVTTEFLTSEGAHAARLMADFEAIVRDIETLELPAP